VLGLDIITKLGLALNSSKGACLIQRDRVSAVENRVPGLDEEQVELDGIARVYISVGEEILAPKEYGFALVNALFPQRFRVIHPIYYLQT